MDFLDPVYGSVSVTEPVLIELIQSKALERLKGVSQIGANQFLQRGGFSRFEHSVGVCELLRRFHAPLSEQIMGLIHDVSHPAFSHVADFVFRTEEKEDYHEMEFREHLLNSDIPNILKKNGLDINDFLNTDKFPMLEQPIPNLCADRIDYFLRHLVHEYQQLDLAKRFLNCVQFDSKKGFFLSDPNTGREFAEWFLKENREIFCDTKMIAVSFVLAEAIKAGLRVGALQKSDLWRTDDEVMQKLKFHAHPSVQAPLQKIFQGFVASEDEKIFDYKTDKKTRFIDPLVQASQNEFKRVSEVFPEYKKLLDSEVATLQKTRFIRID